MRHISSHGDAAVAAKLGGVPTSKKAAGGACDGGGWIGEGGGAAAIRRRVIDLRGFVGLAHGDQRL